MTSSQSSVTAADGAALHVAKIDMPEFLADFGVAAAGEGGIRH
jgi:hypothetical protein